MPLLQLGSGLNAKVSPAPGCGDSQPHGRGAGAQRQLGELATKGLGHLRRNGQSQEQIRQEAGSEIADWRFFF